jgi:SAM-dependent methyltransferase
MTNYSVQHLCPVCGSDQVRDIFLVKDFMVSREEFMIAECGHCSLRFTKKIPTPDNIGAYYRSADYISHTNTSKGLISRLYQMVRKQTLRSKKRIIEKYTGLKKESILDIGSGVGAFVRTMQQAGWSVTGLEPDGGARAHAKTDFGVELQDSNQLFQLPEKSFDAITLWHVLEHVHDLQGYMERLKNLIRPGGRLFIAVPNYTSKDAGIYAQYWAAWDVPRHLYHFSPGAMETLLSGFGFTLIKTVPQWYDSFYVSLLSSKYKHGKTKYMSSFFNGFRSNLKALSNTKYCSSLIYIAGKVESTG